MKTAYNSSINQVSKKQAIKLKVWAKCKERRLVYLEEKYGYALCEYCGGAEGGHELTSFDAHHIDGNRNNNTDDNIYIAHRLCHTEIGDENILVKQEDSMGGDNPI